MLLQVRAHAAPLQASKTRGEGQLRLQDGYVPSAHVGRGPAGVVVVVVVLIVVVVVAGIHWEYQGL